MLTLAKNLYILDISATTVAFFSTDKNAKSLAAFCLEYTCTRCEINNSHLYGISKCNNSL